MEALQRRLNDPKDKAQDDEGALPWTMRKIKSSGLHSIYAF